MMMEGVLQRSGKAKERLQREIKAKRQGKGLMMEGVSYKDAVRPEQD